MNLVEEQSQEIDCLETNKARDSAQETITLLLRVLDQKNAHFHFCFAVI